MITKKEPVLCGACGSAVRGRADKKFCNDYCRNEFNNNLKSGVSNAVRNINHALLKNRRILEALIPPGEEKGRAHRERLAESGFIFKYITNTYTNKNGNVYYFCYDLGYLPLEKDWFLIVRRSL